VFFFVFLAKTAPGASTARNDFIEAASQRSQHDEDNGARARARPFVSAVFPPIVPISRCTRPLRHNSAISRAGQRRSRADRVSLDGNARFRNAERRVNSSHWCAQFRELLVAFLRTATIGSPIFPIRKRERSRRFCRAPARIRWRRDAADGVRAIRRDSKARNRHDLAGSSDFDATGYAETASARIGFTDPSLNLGLAECSFEEPTLGSDRDGVDSRNGEFSAAFRENGRRVRFLLSPRVMYLHLASRESRTHRARAPVRPSTGALVQIRDSPIGPRISRISAPTCNSADAAAARTECWENSACKRGEKQVVIVEEEKEKDEIEKRIGVTCTHRTHQGPLPLLGNRPCGPDRKRPEVAVGTVWRTLSQSRATSFAERGLGIGWSLGLKAAAEASLSALLPTGPPSVVALHGTARGARGGQQLSGWRLRDSAALEKSWRFDRRWSKQAAE